jgi:hypothetical protein
VECESVPLWSVKRYNTLVGEMVPYILSAIPVTKAENEKRLNTYNKQVNRTRKEKNTRR